LAFWNQVSSYGSYITAFATLVFFFSMALALVRAKRTVSNPWGEGATTLEWTLSSPPPFHSYDKLPVIKDTAGAH